MDNSINLSRQFEALAWGFLLIWWGLVELLGTLPKGMSIFGTGVILIGLNTARVLNNVHSNGFSMTIGMLALFLGGLQMVQSILQPPFKFPIFAILLIVLGVIVLVRGGMRFGRAVHGHRG